MPRKPRWRTPMNDAARRLRQERVLAARLDPANKTMADVAKAAKVPRRTAYTYLRQVHCQNLVTAGFEAARLTPAKIVQPVLDGLNACVVVKSSEQLRAVETSIPDYEQRGRSFDRIMQAYGLLTKHQDARDRELPPLPPVNFQIIQVSASGPRAEDRPPADEVRLVSPRGH